MTKEEKSLRKGPLRWEQSYRLLTMVAQNPAISAQELQLEGASVGIEISIRTAFRFLERFRSEGNDGLRQAKTHLQVVTEIVQNVPPELPITPTEIKEKALEQGRSLHLSTVYRILEKLVIAGTLIQQDKAGQKLYKWKRENAPEARIICTTCGAAIEFEKDYLQGMAQTICSGFDYEHQRLELTLYGRCAQCRVKQ